MKNPFSIIDDTDELECSWCQCTFKTEEEGELIVHEKHCDLLCGECLTKYIEELLKELK
jgi:hypothetical protein